MFDVMGLVDSHSSYGLAGAPFVVTAAADNQDCGERCRASSAQRDFADWTK
jgi:hypothetical protein